MSTTKRVFFWILGLLILPVVILWCVVAQPVFTDGERSKAAVDPELLKKYVVTLSQDFLPRTFDDAGNMTRCVSYIDARLRQTGACVTNQSYVAYKTPCQNVVALFQGSKLKHTVELVAYCTEEPPCFASEHMGSSHHARSLAEQKISVKAMIALEMIGFFSDDRNSQNYPVPLLRLFYPSRGNFISIVGDARQRLLIRKVKRCMNGATDLSVYSILAPASLPGVDFSDHRNYWENNFPAVMVTDTAFYRNHRYHQAGDTADRLDYERMAKVIVCVYEAVVALANDE